MEQELVVGLVVSCFMATLGLLAYLIKVAIFNEIMSLRKFRHETNNSLQQIIGRLDAIESNLGVQ